MKGKKMIKRALLVVAVMVASLFAVISPAAAVPAPQPDSYQPPPACTYLLLQGTGNQQTARRHETAGCGEVDYYDYTPTDMQPTNYKLYEYTSATGGTGIVIASGQMAHGNEFWKRLGYVTGGRYWTLWVQDTPVTYHVEINY